MRALPRNAQDWPCEYQLRKEAEVAPTRARGLKLKLRLRRLFMRASRLGGRVPSPHYDTTARESERRRRCSSSRFPRCSYSQPSWRNNSWYRRRQRYPFDAPHAQRLGIPTSTCIAGCRQSYAQSVGVFPLRDPAARSLIPSRRILVAALKSRRCSFLHAGHVHSRSDKER